MNRLLKETWGSPRRAAVTITAAAILLLLVVLLVPPVRELLGYAAVPAGFVGFLIKIYPADAKRVWGQALEHATWLNHSIEREAIRQRVEGSLASGASRVAAACPAAAPSSVRLEFIKSGEEVGELPDGTLVVAIADHRNHAANLANAAWAYARHGVLRFARQYLDRDLSRAIDFVVTRQILGSKDKAAFNYFVELLWRPAISDEARLRLLTERLEFLQDDELFGPVILHEMVEIGIRHSNNLPNEVIAAETADFVDFVFDISRREHGHEGPMDFEGVSIRSKFIFVARADVYALKGPDPYRKAVAWSIEHGYRNIYLLARGKHAEYAIEIAKAFDRDPRVFDTVVWKAPIRQNDRIVQRMVVRIPVDVRYEVGFGQRLILAVGPPKSAGAGKG